MRFHVPQGSRRLAVWSATGFTLLAGSDDRDIRAFCARTNAEANELNRASRSKPFSPISIKPAATAISSRADW